MKVRHAIQSLKASSWLFPSTWHKKEWRMPVLRRTRRRVRKVQALLRAMPIVVNHPKPQLVYQIVAGLCPRDVKGKNLKRIGHDRDGGYVMLESGLDGATVYNLGINQEVSWDIDMALRGCHIYQYDHTIDASPLLHPNVHFSKLGIAPTNSMDGVFKTIAHILNENGHMERRDLILNMDIEGDEWNILYGIDESIIDRFSQIVIEFHDLLNVSSLPYLDKVISVLSKLNKTHQVIHVHANNFGRVGLFGGIVIYDSVEVTYVRKTDHSFELCDKVFPTHLDRPNDPARPDYLLGALGHMPSTSP